LPTDKHVVGRSRLIRHALAVVLGRARFHCVHFALEMQEKRPTLCPFSQREIDN
jgi:hypothetical protein